MAARLALHQDQAADWARRTRECREYEWETARQLRAAAQCFLESFGDQQVEKMTLARVSRAVQVAARLARQVGTPPRCAAGPKYFNFRYL